MKKYVIFFLIILCPLIGAEEKQREGVPSGLQRIVTGDEFYAFEIAHRSQEPIQIKFVYANGTIHNPLTFLAGYADTKNPATFQSLKFWLSKTLCSHPLDQAPDVDGMRPLHHAALRDEGKMVRWLLNNKADPNTLATSILGNKVYPVMTPLMVAVSVASEEAVRRLLKSEALCRELMPRAGSDGFYQVGIAHYINECRMNAGDNVAERRKINNALLNDVRRTFSIGEQNNEHKESDLEKKKSAKKEPRPKAKSSGLNSEGARGDVQQNAVEQEAQRIRNEDALAQKIRTGKLLEQRKEALACMARAAIEQEERIIKIVEGNVGAQSILDSLAQRKQRIEQIQNLIKQSIDPFKTNLDNLGAGGDLLTQLEADFKKL